MERVKRIRLHQIPRRQIIYSTPKSQNVPALRSKRVSENWRRVQRFLENCTDTLCPSNAAFTIFESPVSHRILRDAMDSFGVGNRREWLRHWPSGKEGEFCWEWPVDPQRVNDFVTFLSEREPLPKCKVGPAELTASYKFRWTKPGDEKLLPFQEAFHYLHPLQAVSGAIVWLSRCSAFSLEGYFPFESVDAPFLSFCDLMSRFLPARLNAKYFRLFIPNKQRTAYIVRKLDLDLVFEIERHLHFQSS